MDLLRALQVICLVLIVLSEPCSTGFESDQVLFTVQNRHLREGVRLDRVEKNVPVLEFLQSGGLMRRKRDWVIPPIHIMENARGPFPSRIAQMKSSHAEETVMEYRIRGEGAELPPVGLFTVKKSSGELFVTKPLDREVKANYILQAEAFSPIDGVREPAMKIVIEVTDQNDNVPVFSQNPFIGSVPESSRKGFEFMTVNATDADDPHTYNADIRYSIITQTPPLPQPDLFAINPISGEIRLNSEGLDRENYPEYTLEIRAADLEGNGLRSTGTAVITVTDSNDHPPQFEKTSYSVSVPENQVNALFVRMPVTDGDDAHSPAWNSRFRIINGNAGGWFSIKTGSNKQEGIITTVKSLDFEENKKHILLVVVENETPLTVSLPYSTSTVTVNVLDVNEAPVFDPVEKIITVAENLGVNSVLIQFTATDPDTVQSRVTYQVGSDPAGWLNVNPETGLITVKNPIDRESAFVKDNKYKALILAVAQDDAATTGTGTLIINIQDVNDNAPTLDRISISFCNVEPIVIFITDKDGPEFSAPFSAEIIGASKDSWDVKMINDGNAVELIPKSKNNNDHKLSLKVSDKAGLSKVYNEFLDVRCLRLFCLEP